MIIAKTIINPLLKVFESSIPLDPRKKIVLKWGCIKNTNKSKLRDDSDSAKLICIRE
jgi:hypothetical protein